MDKFLRRRAPPDNLEFCFIADFLAKRKMAFATEDGDVVVC